MNKANSAKSIARRQHRLGKYYNALEGYKSTKGSMKKGHYSGGDDIADIFIPNQDLIDDIIPLSEEFSENGGTIFDMLANQWGKENNLRPDEVEYLISEADGDTSSNVIDEINKYVDDTKISDYIDEYNQALLDMNNAERALSNQLKKLDLI